MAFSGHEISKVVRIHTEKTMSKKKKVIKETHFQRQKTQHSEKSKK